MAPHAETPTTERDEFLGEGGMVSPNETILSHRLAIEQENGTLEPRQRATGARLGAHTGYQSAYHGQSLANGAGNNDDNRVGNLLSESTYEDAYIHGYKEGYTSGYTKSYVDIKHQPIAIIGMSCRLPGNVSTPDEFWELLARSRTGFSPIPNSRFSLDRYFHPNPGKSGTMNARGGNFLTHDLTVFDAPFFGFTQQEAISLDPQQRLLLECTFEALESAGIPKHNVVGKDVGVFVGGTFSEYEADLFRDPETIPMHQATGCAMAMQSNRISHFFDLRGPSFTVDTACSSSLVAIHTACQSLRNGESSMAIAAGVHLNMLPEFWISYSMSRLFGEAGRSFAFDQRGTGYGRGEGCGLILLKPLDQAIADNDPIRAIIGSSGVNQDGRTPGITMPNGSAQEDLIRSVYKNANMDPRDTGYVEAHGTGTRVGDPIEVTALHNVFGEERTKRKPLFIGSVKSNIGHLEAAAGIAGVIKTALMLERGFILPNYDFKAPNEKIPFDQWGMKVAARQQPWPFGKKWASVNGFGFGGTNAHVVMTKGPLDRRTMKEEIDTQSCQRLFLLSANDKSSTEKTMQDLGIYLERRPEVFQNDLLGNLAYTLGQRKSIHPWRVAISASNSVDLVESLFSGKIIPTREEFEDVRFGWIYTGQGAQWWAMGRELRQQYPIYASALDKADTYLRTIGAEFSLVEELEKNENNTQINDAQLSQPACTAVQLALTDLLYSWGIQPIAVAGHSSGEIGAAYAANIITFEDAMSIAYHRGRLIPLLKNTYPGLDGSMMAVGAGYDEIAPLTHLIPASSGEVRIACFNSPSSLTISGDSTAVSTLQELIEQTHPGTFARKLQIDTAYHSHHMNLVAKAYTESLSSLARPKTSVVQLHSSLLGRLVDSSEVDASYWVQNLICAVRFDAAIKSMCQASDCQQTRVNQLIEIGPHAALQGPIKQTLKSIGPSASKIGYSTVLSRKRDAVQTAHELAGLLFVKGACLNIGEINFPTPPERPPRVLTDLPRYAWNHSSTFYHESRLTKIHKHDTTPRNDIIGVLAPYSNDFELTWRNIVRLEDLPWLRHHQIAGVTVFPISGFIAMALEAAAQTAGRMKMHYDSLEVKDVLVDTPAILTEEDLEMTITLLQSTERSEIKMSQPFTIRSWSKSKEWLQHCTGCVSILTECIDDIDGVREQQMKDREVASKIAVITETAVFSRDTPTMYSRLNEIGVAYGSTFQGLLNCSASTTSATAEILVTNTLADMPHNAETKYILHPTFLETLVSMYWPILSAVGPLQTVHLPSSVGKVIVSKKICEEYQKPEESWRAFCLPDESLSDDRTNTLSMFAVDKAGKPVISVENLQITPMRRNQVDSASDTARELCYKLDWEPIPESSHIDNKNGTLSPFGTEVVIVHGESQSQCMLAVALSDQFESSTGYRPNMGTLLPVATQSKGKYCIFISELDQPVLADLRAEEFETLQHLLTSVDGMLWVVRGAYTHSDNPSANMVSGLSRTLRSEGSLMRFVTLDLDSHDVQDIYHSIATVLKVFKMVFGSSSVAEETEFMERAGKLLTPRIVEDTQLNQYVRKCVNPPAVEAALFSDLHRPLKGILASEATHTLIFEDDQKCEAALFKDDIAIQVKAIGIDTNSNLAMRVTASGCSGIVVGIGSDVVNVKVGDHVAAALADHCSISTIVRTHSRSAFKIPDHISFQEAASMPATYCTAHYALTEQARLVEGERVLINDAASAIGQGALNIAQMIGADIWTTVRTSVEKEMLSREYGLHEDRIWAFNNDAIVRAVAISTKGIGVDVIINTVSDAVTCNTTVDCIAEFGRVVNVATSNCTLDTSLRHKNITMMSIDTSTIAIHRPRMWQRTIANIERLLRYGKIQPLHRIDSCSLGDFGTFLGSQKAAKGNDMVVVVPRDDELVLAPRLNKKISCLRQDATYILIGGTGGLGRSIAQWMINNGAQHIVLISRNGSLKGKAKDQIEALNNVGANIIVRRCDVAHRPDVDNLICEELKNLPPIRGIIHGAMVLHDVLFEKMTYEQYTSVIASKVQGAWNFHHALTSSKSHLDFFICISSAAGAVGNRGQAAYAAANTFLNGFAQYLLQQGIPASSIDLTAVSDSGYLLEDAEKAAEVARNLRSDTICEAEVLALMHAAITGELRSCNNHPITGMRLKTLPFWYNDAKFLHLRRAAEAEMATSSTRTKTTSWNAAFKTAPSRAEAEQVVIDSLVEKIAEVISMEPEALDAKRALSHYPLDSLTAIEVRNFITRMFEANLQVLELLASGSIESLARIVCAKSRIGSPGTADA